MLNIGGPAIVKVYSPVPNTDGNRVKSVCRNLHQLGVNNIHFSLATFHRLFYDGRIENRSPDTLAMIAPHDENGIIYHEIHQQFQVVKQIYSLLLLTTNLKPFHVYFYTLPNSELKEPEIHSGVCFFNFENMHFKLDLEVQYRAYLRCLLHQGFLNERRDDSWRLRFVAEGLFEKLLSSYEIFETNNKYYRDAIEGGPDDLAALGQHYEDVSMTRLVRPWRKAAGFFTMLESFSPTFASATYSPFLENNHTVESLVNYWPWFSQYHQKLNLTEAGFADLVYTWTAVDGYPILVAQVLNNRTICLTQFNHGSYFRSMRLPFQIDYNLPTTVHTVHQWIDPTEITTCQTVEIKLYPYLINSAMHVVGRVMYDKMNWEVWAANLMGAKLRLSMTTMQRVQLVTDALYFASQRKLSYSIALRFLFVLKTEVDELAWRNLDKSLEFLEAKIRYTMVYTLFKKTIADVSEKFYNASEVAERSSNMAPKWCCMMGNVQCLNNTEQRMEHSLGDHRFRHLPSLMCAGMRRIKLRRFHELINTMGRPDWREPDFYVDMLLCAEHPKVLRELMHHLFFHNSWRFKPDRLTAMMLKMIKASRAGSDAAFYYLNHDPEGMVKLLGFQNVLEVVQALVVYVKENAWFLRFVRRMKLKGIIDQNLFEQYPQILETLKSNKRFYNTQYKDIQKFFMIDFGKHLRKFEEELPVVYDL